jgi:hypothetical protein
VQVRACRVWCRIGTKGDKRRCSERQRASAVDEWRLCPL